MQCNHELADVLAGGHHPLFPCGYRYMLYCVLCGFMQWTAADKPY